MITISVLLTAIISVLLKIKDGKYYVISHFFMPSGVVEKRTQEDNVPYDICIEKGFIILTEGSQNDFSGF